MDSFCPSAFFVFLVQIDKCCPRQVLLSIYQDAIAAKEVENMKKQVQKLLSVTLIGILALGSAAAVKADDYYIHDLGQEGYEERLNEVKNQGPFYDVPRDAWYCGAIEYCKTRLLLSGDPDGNFRPGDPVSRAEAATVLKRLATKDTFVYETYFSDVPSNAWYAYEASSYGNLLGGYSKQTSTALPLGYVAYFYPTSNVEREDFAVGIYNVYNLQDGDWKAHFKDLNQVTWSDNTGYNYRQAVCAMRNLEIMVGDENEYFHPKQSLTRAELAQILYNIDMSDSNWLA